MLIWKPNLGNYYTLARPNHFGIFAFYKRIFQKCSLYKVYFLMFNPKFGGTNCKATFLEVAKILSVSPVKSQRPLLALCPHIIVFWFPDISPTPSPQQAQISPYLPLTRKVPKTAPERKHHSLLACPHPTHTPTTSTQYQKGKTNPPLPNKQE